MKKHIWRRVGSVGMVLLMLLSVACTPTPSDETITTNPSSEEITDMTDTNTPVITPETPTDSRDLLTFTPASVAGQVLTATGASPQILIENYNETAIDALGRPLPTSAETGLPKEDKYVGLFYFLWTGKDGSIKSSQDVTKYYALNPLHPNLPGGYCWWAEPETGYHSASDVWQIKRDLYYFAMAGVDFLYLDFTNNRTYDETFRILLDTCLELRAHGQMTPYIVPFTHGTDKHSERESADLGGLYRTFYTDEKYADLWFYWEGKPLVLLSHSVEIMRPNAYVDETKTKTFSDVFTFRMGWSSLNWPGQSEKNYMKWNDNCVVNYGYQYGYTDDPSVAECTGIGCAGFANPGEGRSGEFSRKPYLDQFLETDTMGQGITLENAFQQVMEKNPEVKVLLLSRWNEGAAINFGAGTHSFGFVDQFNAEFSRDMEPMKGGYTDNYFYHMCSIIRRFKGVLPADGHTGKQTVDVSGDFSSWQEIKPVFTDFAGDTSIRDDYDSTGTIHYVNDTGRNDIVESRFTADGGMVYVYARTAEAITHYMDKNWMLLFMDTDNSKATGWEGYDFVVNYNVIDETTTTLCAYKNNTWQEIGTVKYRVKGNELMVAIPRSLLGLTGESMTLNFHWLDNVTDVYDLESWFTTGDSAPERRNNYSLTLKVPYDAAEETVLPARTDGALVGMPAVTLPAEVESTLKKGLALTVYNLPEKYGKMPNFEHIAPLAAETFSVSKINANPGVITRKTDYALVYEGYVKIPADGAYTFRVACDDAARLYIDGRLVTDVPYDAERAADAIVSNSGSLTLVAGYHSIRIEYAEIGGGNAGLAIQGEWEFFH